jgi:hypothetical protein
MFSKNAGLLWFYPAPRDDLDMDFVLSALTFRLMYSSVLSEQIVKNRNSEQSGLLTSNQLFKKLVTM